MKCGERDCEEQAVVIISGAANQAALTRAWRKSARIYCARHAGEWVAEAFLPSATSTTDVLPPRGFAVHPLDWHPELKENP